jgi:hypothetical protein
VLLPVHDEYVSRGIAVAVRQSASTNTGGARRGVGARHSPGDRSRSSSWPWLRCGSTGIIVRMPRPTMAIIFTVGKRNNHHVFMLNNATAACQSASTNAGGARRGVRASHSRRNECRSSSMPWLHCGSAGINLRMARPYNDDHFRGWHGQQSPRFHAG